MTEQQLNELNIFALRELARFSGVVSPTSKKKDVLIKEILAINEGAQPVAERSKLGRPPKGYIKNFAEIFSSNTATSNQKVSFQQASKSFECEDISTVGGYVEVLNNNFAFLWVQNGYTFKKIFVPADVLLMSDVKSGDKIVAEIENKENQTVVSKIFNINDCPIAKITGKRKNYSDIEYVLPNKQLNADIKFGENVYLYGNNNNTNTIKIVELLNSLKVSHKIYVNLSLAEKSKLFIKPLEKTELFVSEFVNDVEFAKRITFLAIERAKRLLENGEDIVIALDDALSLKAIDEDLSLTKQLFTLARNTKKGSITLIAIMPTINKIELVEKLADVKLNIE